MLQEVSDSCFSLGEDGLLVEVNFKGGGAVEFDFFDLEDAAGFAENAEDCERSADVGLQPLGVLHVEVLEALHAAHDEIKPADVDDVRTLLRGVFGEKSGLHIFEDREI